MKKIRVIFSLLAIMIGVGGAIASTTQRSLSVAYEFTNSVPSCLPHEIECQIENNGVPCQVEDGPQLRISDTDTMCGVELWKTPEAN